MIDNHETPDEYKIPHEEIQQEKNGFLTGRRARFASKILIRTAAVAAISFCAALIIMLIIFFALNVYLTPKRVEKIIPAIFSSKTNGSMSFKVRYFSLLRGCTIDKIIITTDTGGKQKLLELKRLNLRYNLPAIVTGSVRISDCTFDSPHIYLTREGGTWNFARLLAKTKDEQVDEEKKELPSPELSLPIAVDVHANMKIHDLHVFTRTEEFTSSLGDVFFKAVVETAPNRKIPKSVKALTLIKKLDIALNPGEELDLSFNSKDAEVSPPLQFTWRLLYDTTGTTPRFGSVFKFGTYKAPVRFKQTRLMPLDFLVYYDIYYNPATDYLELTRLGASFRGKKWLEMGGTISGVTGKQDVNLRVTASDISLQELYPYFVSLTGNRLVKFGGSMSVAKLTVTGNRGAMKVDCGITGSSLFFRTQDVSFIAPSLDLACSLSRSGRAVTVDSGISVPHCYYTFKGNRSGDNGLSIQAVAATHDSFSRIDIKRIVMRLFNPITGEPAVDLELGGTVVRKPFLRGSIAAKKFIFSKGPLLQMLPETYSARLSRMILQKPAFAAAGLTFALGSEKKSAELSLDVNIPNYRLPDLKGRFKILYDSISKKILIDAFSIKSRAWKLSSSARGFIGLQKKPISDSDFFFSLSMNYPELATLYGPWQLKGLLEFTARMRGDLKTGKAEGAIICRKFHAYNEKKRLSLSNLNLNFPYNYNFKSRYSGESMIDTMKKAVQSDEPFTEEPTITLDHFIYKHPARDVPIEFVKELTGAVSFKDNVFLISNLKAYVLDGSLYGRNILVNLANLDLEHPGLDAIRDNIEFNILMDLTNVNIGILDKPDEAKKSRDAEISMNAHFSGKGINFDKNINWKGYINIHKIGEKFANRLMKGLSSEKGKSKLGGIGQYTVDNSMKIAGFNFNLDKGNVYTRVTLTRRPLSAILSIKDNMIEFERVPVRNVIQSVLGTMRGEEGP